MRRAFSTAALIALFAAGCGGGSDTTTAVESTTRATEPAGRAHLAAANRICGEMVAASRRMGRRVANLQNTGIPALALTTRELVKPAVPILERSARRLRTLAAEADSLSLESYVSLYDPIVAVVRDRVEAGEAGDDARAHRLELQLLDLSDLQRRIAREAGLKSCDVNFLQTFAAGGSAP
jgi:hypothetical protein